MMTQRTTSELNIASASAHPLFTSFHSLDGKAPFEFISFYRIESLIYNFTRSVSNSNKHKYSILRGGTYRQKATMISSFMVKSTRSVVRIGKRANNHNRSLLSSARSTFSTLVDPEFDSDSDDEKHDDNITTTARRGSSASPSGPSSSTRQQQPPLSSLSQTMTIQQAKHGLSNNGQSNTLDLSRQKAGSPSPWAVFDAWGAGDDVCHEAEDHRLHEDEFTLSGAAVRIPITEEEKSSVPDETDILGAYERYLQSKSSFHFGYPYNLVYDNSELHNFMNYSINNLGDPFVPSNYGVHSRQFECSVIDFFAKLWKMEKDSYWGYVTTSGTEGNLHGILLARENHPDGILYTSNETHYSIFKAARYYRMDCESIPTLPMGEINYDLLAEQLAKNRDRPAIINVNIGTTVKGAIDDLDRILSILEELEIPRDMYHIHCDGALFALMMPFIDNAPEISFQKPIDSIAVSGHKMLGCPMPCGIALCRKEHVEKVEHHIDYLNSVDTTIMGSRNGQAALYMWYSLRKKGLAGIKRDVT